MGWNYESKTKRIFNTDTANDDFIIGGNSTEWVTGSELKMFYDKSKSALRGGTFTMNGSDDSNRGTNSIAWGTSTCRATGASSFAFGDEAQATGANSFAASGSDARASGDYSVAFSGGTASGFASFTATGNGTTASGQYSVAFGGGGTASGYGSFVIGAAPITASRHRQFAFGGGAGEAQFNRMLAAVSTTNATPAVATFNQGAAALTGVNTNVLTIPVNKAHNFVIKVIARGTNTDAMAAWKVEGAICRYSSGNARFISAPVVTADKEAAASAWDFGVSINTSDGTNNYLVMTVTGAAATNIRWAISLETIEGP